MPGTEVFSRGSLQTSVWVEWEHVTDFIKHIPALKSYWQEKKVILFPVIYYGFKNRNGWGSPQALTEEVSLLAKTLPHMAQCSAAGCSGTPTSALLKLAERSSTYYYSSGPYSAARETAKGQGACYKWQQKIQTQDHHCNNQDTVKKNGKFQSYKCSPPKDASHSRSSYTVLLVETQNNAVYYPS